MNLKKPTHVLLGLILMASPAWAAVAVVFSSDNDSYRQALAGIKESVPAAEPVIVQGGKADIQGAQVVITLGDAAAVLDFPTAKSRVAAMISDTGTKPVGKPVMVGAFPDALTLLSAVGDLVPQLDTLAIFSCGDRYDSYLKYLAAGAKISNAKLLVFRMDKSAELVAALRSILGKAQALWVAPDPLFINQDNFRLISQFCLASKIALIAPNPLLTKNGALAGLAPSAKEIGRAAGQAAAQLAAGKNPGMHVQPEKSLLVVSPDTARSLGLPVPSTLESLK
jgi:hypothetical protein